MLTRSALLLAVLSLLVTPALADSPNPYTQPDESWISISGTVAHSDSDSFVLDYGDGVVTVEMDDWDAYGDAYGLLDGDEVTVYGRVDDDLFEFTKIEAGSVYVEDLNTFFYASSDDEEDVQWLVSTPIIISQTTVRGTVSDVRPQEGEFSIDMAGATLTVDTEELGYNPLDAKGFQQIEEGDVVSVTGTVDHEFFDGRVIDAETVITLADNG